MPPPPTVWVDTDVLVNWLAKEETGGRELWRAPYALACAAEEGSCRAVASLTAILEMRFLLRRKKGWTEPFIQDEKFLRIAAGLLTACNPEECLKRVLKKSA